MGAQVAEEVKIVMCNWCPRNSVAARFVTKAHFVTTARFVTKVTKRAVMPKNSHCITARKTPSVCGSEVDSISGKCIQQ